MPLLIALVRLPSEIQAPQFVEGSSTPSPHSSRSDGKLPTPSETSLTLLALKACVYSLFPVQCALGSLANIQGPTRNQLWPSFLGLLWIRPCCLCYYSLPCHPCSLTDHLLASTNAQVLLFSSPGIIGMHHHNSPVAFMTFSEPPRKVGKHLHKPQILAVPRYWNQLIALERQLPRGLLPTIRHVPHAHSSPVFQSREGKVGRTLRALLCCAPFRSTPKGSVWVWW